MDVQMSRRHGVPSVELCDRSQMGEPVGLKGLVEIPGGIGGDMAADVGDLEKLSPPDLVLFSLGHLFSQVGMPPGEENGRVAGNVHSPEFFPLLRSEGVVHPVKIFNGGGYFFLLLQQPFFVDGSVKGGMPGSPLLHKFGKAPRLIEIHPFLRNI